MDIQATGEMIENPSIFDRTSTPRAVAAGAQEEVVRPEPAAPMEVEGREGPRMALAPEAGERTEASSATSSQTTGRHVNLYA
ncbi:MAG: hypothetical protein PHP44_14775 [Kiritimatiellae bacterium]|nr:hypothetical protein [Kiritimatiellia bacterium]MDD4737358.1 hypothetical protein [Kiritimatiellia bacterium]